MMVMSVCVCVCVCVCLYVKIKLYITYSFTYLGTEILVHSLPSLALSSASNPFTKEGGR
jgi:hypothetical protein